MFKTILALSATISVSAYAGDNGGGSLDCKSDSGRTTVAGMAGAPWNGSGSSNLKYTIDGASVELNTWRLPAPNVHVVDFVTYENNKSYSIRVKTTTAHAESDGTMSVYQDDVFALNSVPGTMVRVRPDVYNFKAIIPEYSSVDPRKGTDLGKYIDKFEQNIQVNCTLDVSI